MAIVKRTTTYAVCPECGADAGAVDHLLGRDFDTAWYCNSCGHRYRVRFGADGSVDVSKTNGRKVTTIDVLMLPPQQKPVYFVVEGMRLEGEHEDDGVSEAEHKHFYYESHSCPTNWLDPVMVYHDGDSDPHGLIEFVASRDEATFPPDESWGPNPRDVALIDFIQKAEGVE